jgi:vitamin B12 transporter
LTIVPGIRYDHTNTNGGFASPSLGVAYRIGETTTLRAYGARGFNIPPLSSLYSTDPFFVRNPSLDVEKVNSIQIGMESFAMKYVWFKATLFRHDISDAITPVVLGPDSFTVINTDRQRRQGLEIEMKTKPIHHFSISGGAVYLDLKNRTTSERLPNSPRYTYDIGLEYNSDRLFCALLKGHYVRFAGTAPDYRSKDSAFVWDVHVSKTVFRDKTTTAQVFFSVHNLFNADQYLVSQWSNPSRWAEAGLRVKF